MIAVEPAACPSLTKGLYAFDFGDTGHLTPLVKMHTLGSAFIPPPFHAGGLRYHGMAPLVSHLKELGLIEARAYTQTEVFEAGVQFARVEGILGAEANHAVKAAIDEAVRCREGVSQSILFNLCGHGHFDMGAYIDYFAGKLVDHEYSEDEAMALAGLPTVAALGPSRPRRDRSRRSATTASAAAAAQAQRRPRGTRTPSVVYPSTRVRAVAVAVTRHARSSAISPTPSPGPSVASRRPSSLTSISPSAIRT